MQGAEPFSHSGGPDGVLVIHGFTGNPQSMRPIAETLAEEGLTVELPLLPGHGRDVEDMLETTWADWSGAAEAAYDNLRERCEGVVVVGLSMGGSLTCWLAENHPEIRGIAVINPMVEAPGQDVRDLISQMIDAGETLAPGVGSDIAKPGVSELAYEGLPLRAALSFFGGVDGVTPKLSSISCPVLIMTSRQDHVVPPTSSDLLRDSVSGPVEQIVLDDSYHVATLDFDGERVTKRVVAFALEHLGQS
jgi:carboxylesterase